MQKKHLTKFNIINTVPNDEKNSHQNGYRGSIFQHNTAYDKSTVNITHNSEKLKPSLLNSGTR